MRYMPIGSVLQVFLQNVMCCSRYATLKQEKPGGWVRLCKYWRACFLWLCIYIFYAAFFLFTMITHYIGKTQETAGNAFYLF